jgi:hypothetical protein
MKDQDKTATDLILLAHWEAQSYWQESYTDIYDFCYRLDDGCAAVLNKPTHDKKPTETAKVVKAIQDACGDVMEVLRRGKDSEDRLVLRSDYVGPAFQYTHGFSVFFPWSRTMNDRFWKDYSQNYKFESANWHEFLDKYWKVTMRLPHIKEKDPRDKAPKHLSFEKELLDEISTLVFTGPGQLGGQKHGSLDATGGGKHGSLDSTGGGKHSSTDAGGGEGEFPSIKNYPSTIR